MQWLRSVSNSICILSGTNRNYSAIIFCTLFCFTFFIIKIDSNRNCRCCCGFPFFIIYLFSVSAYCIRSHRCVSYANLSEWKIDEEEFCFNCNNSSRAVKFICFNSSISCAASSANKVKLVTKKDGYKKIRKMK